MSKSLLHFDDMFETFRRVSPTVGLRDVLEHTKLKSVTFQRICYAVMVLNLLYSLCSVIAIVTEASIQGVFIENMLDMSDMLASMVGASLALCKSLNMYFKRKYIRKLMDELREMWPKYEFDDEIDKLIEKTVKPTIKLMNSFSVVEMVVPTLYFFIPVVLMSLEYAMAGKVTWSLPFYDMYPFDFRKSIWVYLACYLSQVMGGFFAGFNDPCTHGVMVALLTNLTLQFKLLTKALSEIGPKGVDSTDCEISDAIETDNNMEEDKVSVEISDIVKRHLKLYELCNKFQSIFSTVLAIQFFLSALIICQQILNITMGEIQAAAKHVVYMLSIIMQMLLPCWYSEVLANESCEVRLGAYSSQWYKLHERHKASLLMIQTRAQREVQIHASVFLTVSLSTFISIMKTAWSYFALMQTMYSK